MRALSVDLRARLIAAARKNPRQPARTLANWFGISPATAVEVLKEVRGEVAQAAALQADPEVHRWEGEGGRC